MTPPKKVLLTHKIPEIGISMLKKAEMDIIILDKNFPLEPQMRKFLPEVNYLIPLLSVNITRELLNIASSLKCIANYAVGYNNIDVSAAKEKNILVTNTPEVLTNATADLVWGLILAVTRRIIEGDTICRNNAFEGWLPEYLLGFEITGKTLGVVGLGRIGTAVVKRAIGFEMRILYYSKTRKLDLEKQYSLEFKENLDDLLKEADIISLNIPYTPETHHLISKNQLALMKSTAYIINTSRGRIIKEADLIIALKNKQIAGAALDVFYYEPDISKELRNIKNLVMTPHIGSATVKARNDMSKMVAENILAIDGGNIPPNLIPEMRE